MDDREGADAQAAEGTDWVQIVEWYDELARLTDSPVVRLDRAVAVGEADGARAGLTALARLDPGLPRYAAVAAYLHERTVTRRPQRGSTPRRSAGTNRPGKPLPGTARRRSAG